MRFAIHIKFFAQFRNAKRAADDGYALILRFSDVTQQALSEKLDIILNEPEYRANAKEASDLFRDNPIEPMAESMYWIEYVARHRGTKVFQSNAVNIPWYIYFHLDILAAIFIALFISRQIIMYILRRLTNIANVQDKNNNVVHSNKMKRN